MVFSRFIWTLLTFVVLIVLTSVLLGINLQRTGFPISSSLLILTLVLETAALIWYLGRMRRDMLRLINALSNDDPTLQFSRARKDPYFSAIHSGFNALIKNFRLVRLDRESEQRFFEETVNHVRFGLLAFNRKGEIRMHNKALMKLFELKHCSKLEDLRGVDEKLPGFLKSFVPGKEVLRKTELKGQQRQLIFLASGFVLRGEEITLVSIRDISREIDRNELEAWQKLLRVLRHEILNSLSPIQLIAGNLAGQMKEGKQEIEGVQSGLETIHRRASSLSTFLDAYTNLYSTPDFSPEDTDVAVLLAGVAGLFQEQLREEGITLDIQNPDAEMHLNLDPRMIEQVMINLLKNAIEAVKKSEVKHISLFVKREKNKTILCIKDSGRGIPADQMESIFIPFYSTRKSGTGVGLSFSRHVMGLHGGQIQVLSTAGKGSEFRLLF